MKKRAVALFLAGIMVLQSTVGLNAEDLIIVDTTEMIAEGVEQSAETVMEDSIVAEVEEVVLPGGTEEGTEADTQKQPEYADESADSEVQESTDNSAQESADSSAEESTDNSAPESADSSVQGPADSEMQELTDNAAEESANDSVQEPIDNAEEEIPDIEDDIEGSDDLAMEMTDTDLIEGLIVEESVDEAFYELSETGYEIETELFEGETDSVTGMEYGAEAYTSGDFTYTLSGESACITGYSGTATDLSIPGTIDGYTVTGLSSYCLSGSSVQRVTIPKSVFSGGISYWYSRSFPAAAGGALAGCDALTEVIFEEGMEVIPAYFCSGAANLKSVSIPDSVTEIGMFAFGNCPSLGDIVLPAAALTLDGGAFYNSSLSSLTVRSNATVHPFEKNDVDYYTFGHCSVGTMIFADGTETIAARFGHSCSIGEVVIGESVTQIGMYAFENTSLETITIPGNVKTVGYQAFYGCTQLQRCILENGVEVIKAYAFSGCSSLTEVSLPESLTTMYGGLFEGTQIRTLTIPPNVSKCIKERVKYPLTGCTELETVIFADGTEAIADYICYESSVKNIVIPDTVTSIGASAFANTEISEAVIPEGIQTIGSYAFGGCANLESFVWPETITEIPSSVFSSCTALTSFVIPEGVTAIGSSAFSGCTGLVSCELPDGLKEIGSDAFFKSGLENIVIPDSVELIEHYAFMNCKNLKNVEFAVSDQVLPGIKNMTMAEVADDDLDTHTMTIGWELYRTQTMEIEYQAFDSCTGLTLITLSNSLQIIGNSAFANCTALVEVRYLGLETEWGSISIESGNEYLTNATRSYSNSGNTQNLDGCEIWIATDSNFSSQQKVRVPYESAESLSVTVDAEEKERVYYVKIRTYRGESVEGGTLIHYGKWSDYRTLTVKNLVTAKEVQKSVEEFYAVAEKYLKALKTEAKADSENKANTKTRGELLKAADDASNNKLLTFPMTSTLTARQKLAVYDVLANYMEQVSELKIEKIDVSKSTRLDKVASDIIKAVQENMCANSGTYSKYTSCGLVELRLTSAGSGFTGAAYLKNVQVAVCNSGTQGTWTTLTGYLKNLCEVTDDLMYQSLKAIFQELGSVTGISDCVKSDIQACLEGFENDLLAAGYGNLQKKLVMLQTGTDLLDDIKKAASQTELENLLKDSKSIWKKIDNMDFSDSAVKKAVLKDMSSELEKQRTDLEKTLYAYAYGKEKTSPTSRLGKTIRKLLVNCPVDVVVYGSNGSILGLIKNGKVSYQPEITMQVKGGTKQIWMDAGNSYSIEFTGSGTGVMNYVVQDLLIGEVTSQIDYYNIPLEEDIVYRQSMPGGTIETTVSEMALVSDGSSISSSSHLDQFGNTSYVTVTCVGGEGGSVSGDSGSIEKGTTVCVNAEPEDGYRFVGWYLQDELKATDEAYYFAAVEDVELEARFTKKIIFNAEYGAVLESSYSDSMRIFLIQETDGTEEESDTLVIYLNNDVESMTVLLKMYASEAEEPVTEAMVCTREEAYKYVTEPIDLSLYAKVEILSEEGTLIATILPKDQIPAKTCREGNHDYDILEEKAATCTEDGYQKLKCFMCEMEKTIVMAAAGHTYEAAFTVDQAATCTSAGSRSRHCTKCDEKTQVTVIPAAGHALTTVVTKAATCGTAGSRYEKCTKCGYTSASKTIAATGRHSYGGYTVTKAATALAAGQEVRTCSVCGHKDYRAIAKLEPAITLTETSLPLQVKKSASLKSTVTGLAAGDYIASWKSANTKIAAITKNGKVTGKKIGSTTITVTLASGLTASLTLKVQKKAVTTKKVTVASKNIILAKGKNTLLHTVVTPVTSLQKVTYKTSNKKVAAVSSKGKITAKAAGKTKITVKSGSKKVTVTVTVPGITNVKTSASVKKGKTLTLKPKKYGISGKVTYTSSNPKVATVSSKGKIRGVKKGKATITVKAGNYAVKCKVTVK